MAHLKDLVAAVARASSIDERSVQVVARYLLADGLIYSGGRGRKVHVGPSDATNLLLGILAMPAQIDAPRSSRLAREAAFIGSEINYDGLAVREAPPFPFMKDTSGGGVGLGAALDALFDEIVRHGDPLDDKGRTNSNMKLEIRRPGLYAAWTLRSGDDIYMARYKRDDPRLDGMQGVVKERARQKLDREDHGKPAMTVWAEVGFETFSMVAEALRGPAPEEGAPAPVPPYDPPGTNHGRN